MPAIALTRLQFRPLEEPTFATLEIVAWIETVPDDEWPNRDGLAEQYDAVVDQTYGRVDEIMAIHSLNPIALAAHNALYASAMAGTATLRKVERELIALVVSLENHCHY